jgi:hypothetical protein
MKIKHTKTYTILADERDDIAEFVSYLEQIVPKKYEKNNLVIDLLKYDQLDLPRILLFLKLSNYHRSTKHSFVLVNASIEIDDVPDELIVVPTLEEAGDIVEMEEIERDLGF